MYGLHVDDAYEASSLDDLFGGMSSECSQCG